MIDLFILMFGDYLYTALESLLACILNPIINRSERFEDWLYKKSFDYADEWADRWQPAPEDDNNAYYQWLHSIGYQNADDLANDQIKALESETEYKTAGGADYGTGI